MALLLSAVRFLPAQDLVDVPLDCLQFLEPLFLFPVAVVKAVFLRNKLLDLGPQRFPGGQLDNAMLPEIPDSGFDYDKIALMRLPVCVAGELGLGVGQHQPLQLLFPLQLGFQRFQFVAGLPHFRIGGVYGRFKLLRGSKAVFLIHIQRLCRLFQIVYLCPMLVAFALALGSLGGYVHKPLHTGLLCIGYLGSGGLQTVFYSARGCGRFGCSGGVLLQNGKNSGAVKIIAQLPGGDGFRPVRRGGRKAASGSP